jgi:tellurite resistance protein TehA-like permease
MHSSLSDSKPPIPAAISSPRLRVLASQVREFSPATFAMVMATGIVSLAAHFVDMDWLARPLFVLNIAAFTAIWILTILRILWYRDLVFRDLTDHLHGPGSLTTVAACCVLGNQVILIAGNYPVAEALCLLGLLLWVFLIYTIFTALTIKEDKPLLHEGITGAWLLAVVATQAVAGLSALIALHWPQPYRLIFNFFALSMWLWGGMLYIWMISLIFYRYTFFRFSPGDLAPPYWINMGAMAISTLTGSRLILNTPDAPFLRSLLPFLKGFTVFYWATGTWWIPMLAILAAWRYLFKHFPLSYNPLYWGAVFPLGMYTASTFQMSRAMELEFLSGLPRVFIWIALAAWFATMAGLIRSLMRAVRQIILAS